MTHRRDTERRSRKRSNRTFGSPPAHVRAREMADNYRCPDCAADTTLADTDGLILLTVAHDPTCPHYLGRTA